MIDKAFCEGFAAVLLGLSAISLSDAAELRGIHLSTSPSSAQVQLDLSLGEPAQEPAPAPPKTVRAAHAPGEGDRDVIIAVDAGHGGVDPGAVGHGGTREKDVTLAIARALAGRINAEPGMRAVLT